MKWNWKYHVVALLILATIAVTLIVVLPSLPDQIPTHFGANGKPDDYMTRTGYAVYMLAGSAAIYLILTFIPFIDPFWKRIQHRYSLLLLIRDLALGFFLFVHTLLLDAASTGVLNVRLFGIGLGLLFVVLGNYLPRIPRNWFFGIRVPWTLASEEVWKRTHRMGGWLFVLGGTVTVILSAVGVSTVIALAVPLAPVFIVVVFVYPYLLYRKLEKQGGPS
jgi:uncharacterized membrane protein